MYLIYIELVILNVLFMLGLFNFKFSFKIPSNPPHQYKSFHPTANTPPTPQTKEVVHVMFLYD